MQLYSHHAFTFIPVGGEQLMDEAGERTVRDSRPAGHSGHTALLWRKNCSCSLATY